MNERARRVHAAVFERWGPWFLRLFEEGREDPPEPAVRPVVALAAGHADALSGRFIRTRDDLDDLLARAD